MSCTQNIVKNTKKALKVGLLALFVYASLPKTHNYAQELPDQYIEELRGVWITNVDSDVLFSRQSIVDAMDYLADRGFTGNKLPTDRPPEIQIHTDENSLKLRDLTKEIDHTLSKKKQSELKNLEDRRLILDRVQLVLYKKR